MLPHLMTALAMFTADSQSRDQRVKELIDAAAGGLDAAAAILGDAIDPVSGRPRCFPGAVAATHTVSSTVWRPDAQTVYVGVEGAPMSQGRFVALPTCEALDADALTHAPVQYLEPTLGCVAFPGLAEARQLVIAARIAFEKSRGDKTAIELFAAGFRALPCHLTLATEGLATSHG